MKYEDFVARISSLGKTYNSLVFRLSEMKKAGSNPDDLGLFARCLFVTHFPPPDRRNQSYYRTVIQRHAVAWSKTL